MERTGLNSVDIDQIFPIDPEMEDLDKPDVSLHFEEWQWGKMSYSITPLNVGESVLFLARNGEELHHQPDKTSGIFLNR